MVKQLPPYEQQLILSHILKKSREYVLTHPDIKLTKTQETRYKKLIKRRLSHEPLAYILEHKEFFWLDFKVTKDTLIPRPETELLVEETLKNLAKERIKNKEASIIDIGTGSGNIIISLAHSIEHGTYNKLKLFATDISEKALRVAKYNAKKHNVDKKIKFLKGNLLEPIIKNKKCSMFHAPCSMIIIANLPYLSEKIYSQTAPDVKNYEPKSALLSGLDGLDHYDELLKQIKKLQEACSMFHVLCYMEISPEQKNKLQKLAQKYFPKAKIGYKKDLAGKWRIAIVEM